MPDFPAGVPLLALASEYVGQSRFLFYRSPEVRVGDAVVSRSSALALHREIDRIGGVDEITCRIDLPLELGGASISAAVAAEFYANPAVRDCGHIWQHTAHRLVGGIGAHLAVAANREPRQMSQIEVANAFYRAFLNGNDERARRFTLPGQDPDSYTVLVRDRPSPEFLADEVWQCWDLYCEFMDNVTPGAKLVVEPREGRYVVTGVLHDVGHPVADWPDEELNEYCVVDSTPLNLRSGPGTDHPAMTAIPVDGCGIYAYYDLSDGRWIAVRWNGRFGFVAASMLEPLRAPNDDSSAACDPDLVLAATITKWPF